MCELDSRGEDSSPSIWRWALEREDLMRTQDESNANSKTSESHSPISFVPLVVVALLSVSANPPARARRGPENTSPAPDTSRPAPHTWRKQRFGKTCVQ